jgi:hypothetical protein
MEEKKFDYKSLVKIEKQLEIKKISDFVYENLMESLVFSFAEVGNLLKGDLLCCVYKTKLKGNYPFNISLRGKEIILHFKTSWGVKNFILTRSGVFDFLNSLCDREISEFTLPNFICVEMQNYSLDKETFKNDLHRKGVDFNIYLTPIYR